MVTLLRVVDYFPRKAHPCHVLYVTRFHSHAFFYSAGEERVQRRAPFVPLLRRRRDGGIEHQAQAHEARSENSGKCHREVSAGERCVAA